MFTAEADGGYAVTLISRGYREGDARWGNKPRRWMCHIVSLIMFGRFLLRTGAKFDTRL
jgi:hypothetical protein